MEKRVFLSVILSVFVLLIWNRMFPAAQQATENNAQVIENKQVTKEAPRNEPTPVVKAQKENLQPEETATLNNENIEAVFSTRNGSVKSVRLVNYDSDLPVTGLFTSKEYEGLNYKIERQTEDEVVFSAVQNGVTIRKTYRLPENEFIIQATMQMGNETAQAVSLNPNLNAMFLDTSLLEEGIERSRDRNLLEYSVFSEGKVERRTGAVKFTAKDAKSVNASAQWMGFRDRYFAAIVSPEFETNGYQLNPVNGEKRLEMSFLIREAVLEPRETQEFSATIFVGPQNREILGRYEMDFEKIHVYFRMGFFDAIAKILEDMMRLFYRVIPNWGVSIIIVSLIIYFVMYPLTIKSMVSMRKMQSLQPKIAELREKHEKNPQKLNQEIMKLYAENKINPLGGCLPLLLQMPIFIALYQMIWRSVIFKGAGFLWIDDLSMPDRLFVLDRQLPVIGNEINLLPILILILMVIQQRMTSKNMITADPNQVAQQKMMMFVMPVVLLIFFYQLGSGLTLYLTVFYLMSIFTQWKSAKIMKSA